MSMKVNPRIVLAGAVAVGLLLLGGCRRPVAPDYSRPLPPGASALKKVDPSQWPSLSPALSGDRAGLAEAIDRSANWFSIASTRQFFPLDGFTHDQARASVYAFRQILQAGGAPADIESRIRNEFDLYMSVGWNDNGVVLFTGYYTPIFTASKTRTPEYCHPLYRKPPDLEVDPAGTVIGRRVAGQIKPYPARNQIEAYPDLLGLKGRELVWMKDKLDAYLVQVQGSAKLNLLDGSTLYIGYSASNGLEYTSVGKLLVADGKLPKDHSGLPAIRAYFAAHPGDLDVYLNRNERYVFFQEYSNQQWPAGSLGFKVTPMRSLATDKQIFPRGGVVLVSTQMPTAAGAKQPVTQLMLDQDTGGAIRAPGRADIYVGIGEQAEQIAGRQMEEGRLYYFLLKPERIGHWLRQVQPVASAVR